MQKVTEWVAEDSVSGEREGQIFPSKAVRDTGAPGQFNSF